MIKISIIIFALSLPLLVVSCMPSPSPREIKLGDCVGGVMENRFRCPEGYYYQIVFGFRGKEAMSPDFSKASKPLEIGFSGTVKIEADGKVIYERTFGLNDVTAANWLREYKMHSVILAPKHLDPILESGKDYTIIAHFEDVPSTSSVWLCYIIKKDFCFRQRKDEKNTHGDDRVNP